MIRIGIAGIGFIAEEYIKLITAGRITGCTIQAMSSRDTAHMAEIQKKYGLTSAHLFTDYMEMLSCGMIDAVVICTPHHFHIQMAQTALEHGLHTLIEKPIGVFSDEAEPLLQTVSAHPELVCGVLYCRRATKAFQSVRNIVTSGTLGQLKRVTWLLTNQYRTPAYHRSKSWRSSWKGEGGGLLLNQASHHLDLLTWLLGEPEQLQAFCGFGVERDIQVETDTNLHMWYPNHLTVQFISSSREFPGSNRLELSGSKGQLILENDCHMTIRTLAIDEREYAATTQVGFGSIPVEETTYNFDDSDLTVMQAAIFNNFIRSIEGSESVLCPVSDAVQSLHLINGAYLSAWEKQPVRFPLDGQHFRQVMEANT